MPKIKTRIAPGATLILAVLCVPAAAQTDRTAVPEAGERAAVPGVMGRQDRQATYERSGLSLDRFP